MGRRILVLGRTFQGVFGVALNPAYVPGVQVGVTDCVVLDWHLRNYPRIEEETSLHSLISSIKESMLAHGATSLAVQWIGEWSPFTEEELSIMATKLKTKGAEAAPAKEAKTPAKGKGNPEALAKAREARSADSAESDKRKIKIVNKENPFREGSNRAASFDALKGAKTVADYKEAGGKPKYLAKLVESGHIELT
jgi:hypothetical protein